MVSDRTIKRAVFELGWFYNESPAALGLRSNWIGFVAQAFGSGNSWASSLSPDVITASEASLREVPIRGAVELGCERGAEDTLVLDAGRHRRIRRALAACSPRTAGILAAAFEHDPRLAPLSGEAVLGELADVAVRFLPELGIRAERRIRGVVARNDRRELERIRTSAAGVLREAVVEFAELLVEAEARGEELLVAEPGRLEDEPAGERAPRATPRRAGARAAPRSSAANRSRDSDEEEGAPWH